MTGALWWLEMVTAFRRRRLLVLNVGIPLLLVLPVSLGGAPAFHAAAVYAVLFVLFGTFGAAIPLIRDGETGILRKLVLTGVPPWVLLGVRGGAGALLDTLQLLPAVGFILLVGSLRGAAPSGAQAGDTVTLLLLVPPLLVGALLAANLVGIWAATLARSVAEGALFCAVISLFLLHGAGVFRTPVPGTAGAWFEAILPFAPLHELLLASAGGAAVPPHPPTALLGAWGGTLVLLLLTLLLSPLLAERLSASVG